MENTAELMMNEWNSLTRQLKACGSEKKLDDVLRQDLSGAGMSLKASEAVIEELKDGIQQFYESYDYIAQSNCHAVALRNRLRELLENSPLEWKEKYSVLARLKRMTMQVRLLCTSEAFAREGVDVGFISQAVELEYEAERSIVPGPEDYEALLEETALSLCRTGIHGGSPQTLHVLEEYLETNDGIALSAGVEEILNDERKRVLLKSYIVYKQARFGQVLPEETRGRQDWDNPITANIAGQQVAAEHEKEKYVASAVREGTEEKAAEEIEIIGESLWLGMTTRILTAGKLAVDTALVYGGQAAAEALTLVLAECGVPAVAARIFSEALIAPIVSVGQKGLDQWKENPQAVLRDIREFNRKAQDFLKRRVVRPAQKYVLEYGRKICRCVTEKALPAVNRKWKAFIDIVGQGKEQFISSVERAKEQIYRKASQGIERSRKAVAGIRRMLS